MVNRGGVAVGETRGGGVRETQGMQTHESTGRRSLLDRIEAYYDAVPRADSRPERLGPLTLFVADRPGFRWYARPSLGADGITAEDVAAVRRRQRALGQPESFEWVAEVTPSLLAAAEGTGLAVSALPLMALDRAAMRRPPAPAGVELRLVTPDDDLGRVDAVARIGFAVGGTAVGELGVTALAGQAAEASPALLARQRERLASGRTVTAVALVGGDPVSVGSHQPVGGVSEVVGVATLPAMRRRGLGAAVTGLLVADAVGRGVEVVFLSAGSDEIARVYGRIGFRRVGTACIAEPSGGAYP
jgi:ribosomal protein S18 acetylase RimI-like enzyme